MSTGNGYSDAAMPTALRENALRVYARSRA